MRDERHATGPT